MPLPFFPISSLQEVRIRKEKILSEYHWWDDELSVAEIIYFSDRVDYVREQRGKAISKGEVYLG